MDPKFDTSPEIASQRLEYWNLSVGLRKVNNSTIAKREIKPVQQYVGYETGAEIVGTVKKRGPTVSKQQLGKLFHIILIINIILIFVLIFNFFIIYLY
jgi:hypothetical protein